MAIRNPSSVVNEINLHHNNLENDSGDYGHTLRIRPDIDEMEGMESFPPTVGSQSQMGFGINDSGVLEGSCSQVATEVIFVRSGNCFATAWPISRAAAAGEGALQTWHEFHNKMICQSASSPRGPSIIA